MNTYNDYKYILTFDVGIKNLAYCLVRYSNTRDINKNIDILHWGIMDISPKTLHCKNIVNKRKICNKIALMYSCDNNNHSDINNMVGYCKNHIDDIKKNDNILYKKLHRISKNDIFKNTFNLQMDRLFTLLEVFYNKIISLYHTENPEKEALYNKEFIVNNLQVYIENQPVLKNPIMKSISIGIFSFFTLKKISVPKIIKSVNFISANDKTQLTFINSMKNIINVNSSIDDFKNYNKRKEFSIDIINQYINVINPSIHNIVASINYLNSKKKDDYADTLIYVLFIILKHHK